MIRVPFAMGLALFLSMMPPAQARVDRIAAPLEEVTSAAEELLKPHGYSVDRGGGEVILTSHWIEDETVREKKFFHRMLRKTYRRRMKIRLSLRAEPAYTEVAVTSEFRYRPKDGGVARPWKKLSPSVTDRMAESEYFQGLLTCLQQNRGRT